LYTTPRCFAVVKSLEAPARGCRRLTGGAVRAGSRRPRDSASLLEAGNAECLDVGKITGAAVVLRLVFSGVLRIDPGCR